MNSKNGKPTVSLHQPGATIAESKPKPHELATVIVEMAGQQAIWENCTQLAFDPSGGLFTFMDDEGKVVMVSKAPFIVKQQAVMPKSNIVVPGPIAGLSMAKGK